MNDTRPKWQNPDTTSHPPPPQNVEHQKQDRNKTVQEHDKHDYTRLTHNNRQDKIRKNKDKKGREGGEPSQCQQGSPEGH